MRGKNIQMFTIGISILVVGIIFAIIGNSIATSDSTVLRNQEVDNLLFENASLEYENNISTYTVDVTNKQDNIYNLKYINIKIKNEENNEYTLIGYIGDYLNSNETRKITASIDKDITDITSITYSIVK